MITRTISGRRKRIRLATRTVSVLAVGVALSTCGAPRPDVHDVPTPSSRPLNTSASSSSGALGFASSSVTSAANSAPSIAPSASASVAPPPARIATPGKIQCETVDCDLAKEVCCVSGGVGRCVPRPKAAGTSPCDLAEERRCDESADCQGGKLCCVNTEYDKECVEGEPRWTCTTRCGSDGVLSQEACLRGSTCAAGGCVVPTGSTGASGFCPAQGPELACGAVKCRGGEACCWDPKSHTGSCTTAASCDTPASGWLERFTCERPGDCGSGYDCFSRTGMAMVQDFRCASARCSSTKTIDGPFLCSSLADCPVALERLPNVEFKAVRPTACMSSAEDPPGVKSCRYR